MLSSVKKDSVSMLCLSYNCQCTDKFTIRHPVKETARVYDGVFKKRIKNDDL